MRSFHVTYIPLTSYHFNNHLRYLKENEYTVKYCSYEEAIEYGLASNDYFEAYLKVNFINITLTYRKFNKWINICHNLATEDTEEELVPVVDPSRSYSHLQRYAHIPDMKNVIQYEISDDGKIKWPIINLGALRYFNSKYFGRRYENVIGYDMNSAFLTACIDLKIPDCSVPYREGYPKKGEVGFNEDGIPFYGPSSFHCEYVFPCIVNEGLTKWAMQVYNKKRKAKTKFDKQHWKDMGNFAIGMIARHNPFVRNCIIWNSNQKMLKMIDGNVILCNTDSIVTQVERNDLVIGEGIGEFKIEHKGSLAVNKRGYQWNDDLPIICGFVKNKAEMFEKIVGRKYDILIDDNLSEIFIQRTIDLKKLVIKKRDIDKSIEAFLKMRYNNNESKQKISQTN